MPSFGLVSPMRDIEIIRADYEAAKAKRDRLANEFTSLNIEAATPGELQRADRIERGLERAADEVNRLDAEFKDAQMYEIRRGRHRESGDGSGNSVYNGEVNRTRWDDRDEQETISRALKSLDRDGQRQGLRSDQLDQVDRLLRAEPHEQYQPSYIAKRILLTENPAYRSAFMRSLAGAQTNTPVLLTGEEADAMRAFQVFERDHISRAMGEVTTTAGGFGVPVFIDSSIILTTGAVDAPMLRVCRIEQVTNNIWKGVSSAGMSWSYDTEAAEVSDDSPTLAQPSITVHMARGFIPYSIEVGMDYANFASEMGRLLNQGYNDLLAVKTMTGTGTGEPWGIFTAIDQTSASEVTPTTDGSFGGVDVFKVWNSLRERFRSRAVWVMSVHVESAIRQFAASAGSSSAYFTVDLTQDGVSRINGRPVIVTDYAPTMASGVPGTTGPQNILVVGDPSTYVFAQRAGMSVEAIPHLWGSGSRLPTGQRGLFAWARNGADSVADEGWRLLQNQ